MGGKAAKERRRAKRLEEAGNDASNQQQAPNNSTQSSSSRSPSPYPKHDSGRSASVTKRNFSQDSAPDSKKQRFHNNDRRGPPSRDGGRGFNAHKSPSREGRAGEGRNYNAARSPLSREPRPVGEFRRNPDFAKPKPKMKKPKHLKRKLEQAKEGGDEDQLKEVATIITKFEDAKKSKLAGETFDVSLFVKLKTQASAITTTQAEGTPKPISDADTSVAMVVEQEEPNASSNKAVTPSVVTPAKVVVSQPVDSKSTAATPSIVDSTSPQPTQPVVKQASNISKGHSSKKSATPSKEKSAKQASTATAAAPATVSSSKADTKPKDKKITNPDKPLPVVKSKTNTDSVTNTESNSPEHESPSVVSGSSSEDDSDSDDDSIDLNENQRSRGRGRKDRKPAPIEQESTPTDAADSKDAVPDLVEEAKQTDPNTGKTVKKSKKKRQALKKLTHKPVTDFEVGKYYDGKVVYMKPFGAFIDISCLSDAFCHVSRIGDEYVDSIDDVLTVGDAVRARVIEVNEETKKITVSLQSEVMIEKEQQSITDRNFREQRKADRKQKRADGTTRGPGREHEREAKAADNSQLDPSTDGNEAQVVMEAPKPVKNEADMTPAELKRARKLERRAERRAQQELTGIAA